MNKELKDRVFDIPSMILFNINKVYLDLKGEDVKGIDRAETLLLDKTVNYGQLKRIIHDLENTDKIVDKKTYALYGGDLMLNWGKQYLKGERDLIRNKKKSRKRANDIASLNGVRNNSFLKKHNKNLNFKIPTNLVKSNSENNSIASMKPVGLFEEIKKIKKLIKF